MADIIFETPVWWIFPVILGSLLLTAGLYYRSKSFSPSQRMALSALRFLIFMALGLLLLSPLIRKQENSIEKPVLLWLEDHSESMISVADSTRLRRLKEDNSALLQNLAETYDVQYLNFSLDIMAASDSFSPSGTDIDQALREVRERYYNQNLAGIVLISDGIYNRGGDPSYTAARLPVPVYTLSAGDSSVHKDLLIEKVIHNKVSYFQNEFPVEVAIRARAMEGVPYTLSISNAAGETLVEEQRQINSPDYFTSLTYFIKAKEPGFQQYKVELTPLSSVEEPATNNRIFFNINVLSDRKQVHILARAPHPDLAALGRAIASAENYELRMLVGNEVRVEEEADVFILHDPSAEVLNEVRQSSVPFWLIQGESTNLDAVDINFGGRGFEATGTHLNLSFNLFEINSEQREFAANLPPLWSPFGSPKIGFSAYPLFLKKVGAIKTEDPLWFYRNDQRLNNGEQRSAYTLGTRLWRWRIYDYRFQQTHDNFNTLILKTIQFLSTQPKLERFEVDLPNQFNQSDRVSAEARLYNASFELNNEPEATIKFTSAEGEEYTFSFNRVRNLYRLNAGSLPPGSYQWRAQTRLGEEDFSDEGNLIIMEEYMEQMDLVARPQLMARIAEASGGKHYYLGAQDSLKADLLNNPMARSYVRVETTTRKLVENYWFFFILLVLLAAEWGLRKYFGRY